jgi:hypothetical protein
MVKKMINKIKKITVLSNKMHRIINQIKKRLLKII